MTLIIASCAVKYQRPEVDHDNLVRDANPKDTTFDISNLNWRNFYKDPILCELIDSALVSNLDLQVAIKRIDQAASYFKQSKAFIFPTLGAKGSASYSNTPYFTVGISASWEIDIWGKLTKAKRAKYQQLLAQEGTKNAIITQLIANLAKSYFTLIALDTQKEFVVETIANREKYLETVKMLKQAAKVNEIAVLQAQSQLLSAQEYLPDINNAIYITENTISLLLGKVPQPIKRTEVENINNLIELISPLDSVGIPVNLLRNRPDVIAAEHTLISTLESFNSAKAAMYPALTLSGNISSDATQISQWFAMPSSLIWGIVGGLIQPIFNGRALKTQKEVAYKEFEAATFQFKSSVLSAGIEVSNALSSFNADKEKTALVVKQFYTLDKAYEYSVELLVNGYASYLDVLTAQEGVFNAQISLISGVQDCINDQIELYRALGGGWSVNN